MELLYVKILFLTALGLLTLTSTYKNINSIKPLIGFGFFLLCFFFIIPENFILVSIIASLIIFQKEVKRLLNIIGNKTLFFISSNNLDNNGHTLMESLNYLAKTNCGAIIIVKQKDNIPECSGGIVINGIPSTPLILSIFNPYSPLHDGAVLIEDNQVSTARLILPLSNNEKLHKYGTRHRAGMGLSETCDALIFVVSEETGTISCFHNQQFIPNITQEELHDKIQVGI